MATLANTAAAASASSDVRRGWRALAAVRLSATAAPRSACRSLAAVRFASPRGGGLSASVLLAWRGRALPVSALRVGGSVRREGGRALPAVGPLGRALRIDFAPRGRGLSLVSSQRSAALRYPFGVVVLGSVAAARPMAWRSSSALLVVGASALLPAGGWRAASPLAGTVGPVAGVRALAFAAAHLDIGDVALPAAWRSLSLPDRYIGFELAALALLRGEGYENSEQGLSVAGRAVVYQSGRRVYLASDSACRRFVVDRMRSLSAIVGRLAGVGPERDVYILAARDEGAETAAALMALAAKVTTPAIQSALMADAVFVWSRV